MIGATSIKRSGAEYAEYITTGQYEESQWEGESAARLGIQGEVMTAENLTALAERRHPFTGEELKPKHKQIVTLWDLTPGAPKSASLLALYDPRIREAHQRAALSIPATEEALVPTRNLIYVQVHHYESRALDPHMHTHTLILNLTYNPESDKWECLQHNFMNWYAQKELTEGYRGQLAQSLVNLGYRIDDKPKYGFEIEGVSKDLIAKYSQRSREFEANGKYNYRQRGFIHKEQKRVYAETYDAYVVQQREKLTPSERQSLRQLAERAYEQSYKMHPRMESGEGEDHGHRHRELTYGQRVSL